MFDNDAVKIVRGRTATSQNLLHCGFRYSADGKLTLDGRQAWRCVKRKEKCCGRLYTLNGTLVTVTKSHNHDADISDCEVKEILSQVHDLAASSMTINHSDYCFITGSLSKDARVRLPSEQALKKKLQRARRQWKLYPGAITTKPLAIKTKPEQDKEDCIPPSSEALPILSDSLLHELHEVIQTNG